MQRATRPFATTCYRCQGKAAVMYNTGVNPLWSTKPRILLPELLQMGYTRSRTAPKQMTSLGYERSSGKNKRKLAQGTFITLPWAKEPRASALYQINLKKKKIHLSQPHSFGRYHYKTNRNKVIRKL